MKTLTIALCMLLVILPVSAQQIAAVHAPNFYVPYGVRNVPVAMESSSDVVRIAEPPQRGGVRPIPRPYPMPRGRNWGYGPGYGPYWQPPDSTAEAVVGAVIAVVVLAVLAGGDR
ncbi:MAG TPA: hypothetical protein VFA99_18965 [Acidobacteriaceae bacterium]|nr:hypothetical protein [Acidobacteriaceae bacterium]